MSKKRYGVPDPPKPYRGAAAILCLIVLVGCARQPLIRQSLLRAEERWRRAGVKAYRIQVDIDLFSLQGGAYDVTVREGQVVDAKRADSLRTKFEQTQVRFAEHATVEGMFRLCEAWLEELGRVRSTYLSGGTTCSVRFDSRYGLVRDFVVRDPAVKDGPNQRWRVMGFRVLSRASEEPKASER